MRDPALADRLGDELRQHRIGLQQPPPRRDAVGHVVELAGPQLVEVPEQALAQDLRVQLRDAVHRRRADETEVRHADVAVAGLVDEGHPPQPVDIARELRAHLLQEPPVDLVDDLEMARQQALHHRHWPLLQRLLQDRVVRVARRPARQVPRRVPVQPLEVDQDAHQLGDDERRVRVVQVDEHLVGQRVPRLVEPPVPPQDVLQRTGDEEVLLAQAELLARRRVVVRIEDLGEVLGQHLALDGLDV